MTSQPTTKTLTPGQIYARAMDATQRYVAGVRKDHWTSSTPCSEWNVRDVVNHLTGENLWAVELFQGKTIADVGNRLDGDLLGDDPIGAYTRSVAATKAVVEAPDAMEATCHLSFGDFAGSEYASQLFMDTLIHGWDVAKGSGQDATLDSQLVDACLPIAERLTTGWRSSGVFGENLEVPPGADPQTKLLALVGRRP